MGVLQGMIMQQLTTAAKKKLGTQAGSGGSISDDAIQSAVDAILGGLKSNTNTAAGAEKLDATLGKNHDGSILNDVLGALGSGAVQTDGGKILDHIFGRQQNQVATKVGKQTGLDKQAVIALMIALAPIVLGQLGKLKKDKNLNSEEVADTVRKSGGSGIENVVAGMLDQNKDGSIVDDILRMGTNLFGKK